MPDNVKTICVCGAGTMGAGIALLAAQSGFKTILYELNASILEGAKADIHKKLLLLSDRKKITTLQAQEISGAFTWTNDIGQCKADLIIEAVIEKPEVKTGLFQQLMEINEDRSIYATNTSSLSVSSIAARLDYPELLGGMHFFNPAPIMKLVEVVRGEKTAPEVIENIIQYAKAFGKITVVCKDAPGFIVNRVARHYYLEALRLLESGEADIETIDAVLESTGFPMGPFRLMDLIGNDINLAVTTSLYEAFGKEDRFKPSSIQIKKVADGELGKKSGKGYYDYSTAT